MDTNTIMLAIQDKLPQDTQSQAQVRDRLEKLSDDKRNDLMRNLPNLKLKSPALVFWVGSFLFGNFGVGRFMIGDIGLGIVRLALLIIGIICDLIGLAGMAGGMLLDDGEEAFEAALGGGIMATIGGIFMLITIIWWIVDLFIVGKKLRAQNMQKILDAIR